MARTVNRNRKMLPKQQMCSIDLEGTLKSALVEIQNLINTYGDSAKLQLFTEQYSNSDREYLHVVVDELETDSEMETRIAKEEKWAEQDEKREREEYKRLDAKFGN